MKRAENTKESIYIGDLAYRQENGKNWTKTVSNYKGKSDGKGITVKNNDISNENKKEFLTEETKIDGRNLTRLDTNNFQIRKELYLVKTRLGLIKKA